MTTYHFYSDAGHGWLKVPYKDIVDLNIENDITEYSFKKGKYVYLEEDCDAQLFAEKKEQQTGKELDYKVHNIKCLSKIRAYKHYLPR